MQYLTAQVTSGLLQFPEVTVEALGEDEITLESVLRGKFAAGKNGLAYLTCGPQLEVVHSITGERLSAYRFSSLSAEAPVILAVKEFSWQKRSGLLIGLEDAEGSVLCLYDLGISRVVKAVVLPGRVIAIEPIINHGGASASTQHLHPSLRWLFGVAAVATNIGQILLIDLCLDDLSCSQNEVEASDLEVIAGIPAEVPHLRERAVGEGRHLCFQLVSPSGTAVSALSYVHRTNQLAVGFSDGYLALWNMKSMKREYCAQLEGGRVPVCAVTVQEPENDPRNCCYLWAVQSTQDSEGDVLSLHLLQLAFGDRKCLASGQILYEGLEYCEERYTLDLTCDMFPLRGQTSNTKLLGCQSIEKFRPHGDREEGMSSEALSPDTSVSVFTWQVNIYGQGKPSIYLGIFDINRWYHAQMPDSLRSGESLHNCSYFALWSLDPVVNVASPHYLLDILVHERSVSRGLAPSYSPPEQFFNPSSYNFDATCLLNSGVVHITCTGFQKETLTFLKKSGPFINEVISDGYNRCLMAGLLSPRLIDIQPSSLSQEEQLKAVLSAAIHTSSLGLLTGYIRRWILDEQPNSAANLRFVLEWTWNKMILTKEEFDRLCTPLFDGSCRFIDPQTIQSIQQCHLLLSNLNTVLSCFATEAQEITERGRMNLTNKCMVSQLICQYAQMVLWFSHSGLLPEGLDDAVQLSRLCYNYPVIQNYYSSRRQKCELLSSGKWNSDYLMIDGMVSQLGERVEKLWKRDEGGTGKYPPPTLHALLDIYLLDNITETSKHFITIYLLLDIMHSYPNKTDASIESFPTAFAISWDQVKLIQGFWLIDHNDYENGLDLLFHPATAKPFSWQHSKIIQAFLSQGEHRQALRYIQTMKPTLSSDSDIILHITVLLFNRCMIEAWSLLRHHCSGANVEELLAHTYRGCQEVGLMEDLLKLPFTDTEQECLVRFLQSSTSVQNHELLLVHHLQRANYIPALKLNQTLKINLTNDRDPHLRERSVARNSILDQYGKVLPRVHRKLAMERAKPYHVSTSVIRKVSRPKPLSAVPKQAVIGTVVTRSTFIHNVLSKVGEIWKSDEPENSTLAYNSPRLEGPSSVAYSLPDSELPGAFVGTPVLKASQKVSRLLDLVARPVPQLPPDLGFAQQTPTRYPAYLSPSSLPGSSPIQGSHKNTSRASELHLLETPVVVKKAKTLAMSITSSGFAEFTPQSILRSGLRSTPLGSPSQSPGRSLTPPLRLKETRISFMEEGMTKKWTSGAADDNKTKVFVTIPLYKCGTPGETECLKNKDKTSFFLNSPEMGHQEMDVRSENTPSQNLEKLDVSKENSNVSTESLEYQDAPSPGEFEHVIMATKPASTSPGLMTEPAEETEKDSDKDVFGSVTPLVLEKPTGTLEDGETKDLLVAEEVLSVLNHSGPMQGVEASLCVPLTHERKILTPKSKVPLSNEVSVETCTSTIRTAVADVPGLDAAQSLILSEHGLGQEKAVGLEEDHEIGVDALTESADLPEEKPPISDESPDTQEVHVIENEKREVQDSRQEAKNLSFNDYPSGTLKLQYNFETMEQQFCDLPGKDSAECGDIAEADGELFVAQSNFTLILEGEEEVETGDSAASDVLAKAANTVTDSKHVYTGANDHHGHVANLPSVITNGQESQKTEAVPHVPEPMKAAGAENVIDVTKDNTGSKEITLDTMEQSIRENIPLMSRKVTSSTRLVRSTRKTVQDTSAVTMNVNQVNDAIPPRPRTRRQRAQSLDVPSGQQEESAEAATPEVRGLSARRKTRKTKEASEASAGSASPNVNELAQTQQMPPHPVTPKRGRRKKDPESLNSVEQELQVTPGRVLRSSRSSQLEPATTETSLEKEVKLSSVPKKTPKRMRTSVENQERVDILNDLKTSQVASPSIRSKRLRSTNLETSESTGHEQDGKFRQQQLPVQISKRIKKRDSKVSDAGEDSNPDPSPSALQAEGGVPATPRRRGRPRKVSPPPGVGSEAATGEENPKSQTQKRSARNTPAKSENTEGGKPALEKSALVPNEDLVSVMSSKKKITKGIESQSQKRSLPPIPEKHGGEDRAQKEPKGREGQVLAKPPSTPFSRSTRTRSSKAILPPDLSAPDNEALFSPPASKASRKDKAIKVEAPEQLRELISDLSSPFVLSPPALRTRRKNLSKTPQPVQELEDDGVGQRRGKRVRTEKPKQASRTPEKESCWSPPPVEIKLISPLATPAAGGESRPRRRREETGKALGRSRKKPSSFPKQIVRRKML